ncbi:c-type cytochrome biogenesis protein CcsB [Brachybacterium muris]|uniref:Cytochrome C biogenesis protein CcsB n=1 Tax=Brachybacterium muris UCD-AY4 TaxID=1249481 RepID=A0A022L510_9MICO|nr:c-type cytochrome biogenesis protein CcsB [Brachybacterium muris]EYT51043.1 cytochrome C biogenesis protein CcsB [Brachybacterium muris UCD-AY4]MCT1654142.1 c-type cytochrome biogenesis protein CcsB [Brachybacterium muris]
MIDQQLAEVSNLLIVVAIVLYVLALFGFTADLAATTARRSDARIAAEEARRAEQAAQAEQRQAVPVGAGAPAVAGSDVSGVPGDASPDLSGHPSGGAGSADTAGAPRSLSAQGFAFLISTAATVAHTIGVVLRAVATERVPWTNMYEFAVTSAALVMVCFLVFSIRRRDLRVLGTFVVGPILLLLFIAQRFWIVPAAQLTPSLQNSHWLVIHIGVAILATALSILGAVVAGMQLLQARHERALAGTVDAPDASGEHWGRFGHVLDRLPASTTLEGLSFRIHSVGFVCWTFTLIFGSIWAREAWGRYWNWDPKEVWTFVIWVIYAAYLHARATGGFRGSRAAWLALAGFVAVVFNYTIVNTVINGLHSYSGL